MRTDQAKLSQKPIDKRTTKSHTQSFGTSSHNHRGTTKGRPTWYLVQRPLPIIKLDLRNIRIHIKE